MSDVRNLGIGQNAFSIDDVPNEAPVANSAIGVVAREHLEASSQLTRQEQDLLDNVMQIDCDDISEERMRELEALLSGS